MQRRQSWHSPKRHTTSSRLPRSPQTQPNKKTKHRGCKFSLERTKEKLDNFHAIKTSMPEWFDKWVPRLDICSLLIKDVNKTISPSLTFFGNYTHHHLRHIDAVGTRKTPQFRKFCPLEYFFRFQDLTGEVRDRCQEKFPGAQAWSSCHPQSVCQGELFLIKFTLTKWGGPIEDEVGRPDPNEHDGDGRCSGKWAAVSDQVKCQNSKAISGCADGLDPTWKASPHRTLYGADKGKEKSVTRSLSGAWYNCKTWTDCELNTYHSSPTLAPSRNWWRLVVSRWHQCIWQFSIKVLLFHLLNTAWWIPVKASFRNIYRAVK